MKSKTLLLALSLFACFCALSRGQTPAGRREIDMPTETTADSSEYVRLIGDDNLGKKITVANFAASLGSLNVFQPLDSDLTAIAALTTGSFGRSLLTGTSAAQIRSMIGSGTGNSNFSGAYLDLSNIPPGLGVIGSGTNAASIRALIGSGTSNFSGSWLDLSSKPTTSEGFLGSSGTRGISSEVWIALRTDGQAGSGTAEDPFDGSTYSKFDTLMRNFPTYTTIHLGPGTFQTEGMISYSGSADFSYNPAHYPKYPSDYGAGAVIHGFLVKEGQKIIGSGMYDTTIQLCRNWGFVIGSSYGTEGYWADNFEASDFTVDCNWGGYPNTPFKQVGALQIAGQNIKIRRVRCIKVYGEVATGNEATAVWVHSPFTESWALSSGWPDVGRGTSGNEISGCVFESFSGDYNNCVWLFSFGPESGPTNLGVIQNCVARDIVTPAGVFAIASSGSGQSGASCIGNVVERGTAHMFYSEGDLKHVKIEGNIVRQTNSNIAVNLIAKDNTTIDDISIANNLIEFTGTNGGSGVDVWAEGTGVVKNLHLKNNVILDSATNATGIALFNTAGYEISGNVLNTGTNHIDATCSNGRVVNNRTLTGATPPGLAENYFALASSVVPVVAGNAITVSSGTVSVVTGTTSTTAAAGNDSRITGALAAVGGTGTNNILNTPTINSATGIGQRIVKYKGADTSRSNTTTYADDPDLVIPVNSGETWMIECNLNAQSLASSAGFKVACAFPSSSISVITGPTIISVGAGTIVGSSTVGLTSGSTFIARDSGAETILLRFVAYFTFTASGNFSLQWAQNTSNGTASILHIGSSIACTRLQ